MAQLIISVLYRQQNPESLKGVQWIQMIITQTFNTVYSKHGTLATSKAQI